MKFRIDRDSVCAGDDSEDHAETMNVPEGSTLANLLDTLRDSAWYPTIMGGKAAWHIAAGDPRTHHSKSLAVVAQEWDWKPKFIVDPQTPLRTLLEPSRREDVFIQYRTQEDPEKLYQKLNG